MRVYERAVQETLPEYSHSLGGGSREVSPSWKAQNSILALEIFSEERIAKYYLDFRIRLSTYQSHCLTIHVLLD